jgi:uncharacterized protein (TIGR03086 family)
MANQTKQDLLGLYRQASEWTLDKVRGAKQALDSDTPCDGWNVRNLMNHMLETQHYFVASAQGDKDAKPPSQTPPTGLLSDDPVADFTRTRQQTIDTFSEAGVIERTGPSLGIAFADQLLHGWDLAKATGQDATMPDGLAEAAYGMIQGKFTEEQRKGVFDPEIEVGDDASPQDRLLAYTGRRPAR